MPPSRKKQCGAETGDGKPCKNLINRDADACHLHNDEGTPKGHGATVGNTNAIKHGAYMSLERRVEHLRQQSEEDLFEALYAELRRKCENDINAASLASYYTIHLLIEEEMLTDGMFSETPVTTNNGEPITDPETGETVTRTKLHDAFDAWIKMGKEWRLLAKEEGYIGNEED